MVKQRKRDQGDQPEEKTKFSRRRPRRAHGEGSVYQRKSDKRWVAKIPLEDGTFKEYYFKKESEAVEKLQQAQYEKKQGLLATGPQQTLSQYLEHWLEDVHRPSLRLSTYKVYRYILNKHLLPAFGHLKVQKLTPQHVQTFYAKKLRDHLSATRVKSIHMVLHSALDHAVLTGLVGRNVCDQVKLPRARHREIQPLTPLQAQWLLQEIQGHHMEVILILALTTGMRQGELLSLRWQDIDLRKGDIEIRRSVSYHGKQGFLEDDPKTDKGRRKIVLPDFVGETLKRHRMAQLEMRLQAGPAWIERDLVFCNKHGGFLIGRTVTDRFVRLLKKIGLPSMHFHDLRHSAATLFLSMGVNVKVIQELLGHSNISTTLDVYSHTLPSMQEEAMEKMNKLLQPQDVNVSPGRC